MVLGNKVCLPCRVSAGRHWRQRVWAHALNLPFTKLVIVGNFLHSLRVSFLFYKIVLQRVLSTELGKLLTKE